MVWGSGVGAAWRQFQPEPAALGTDQLGIWEVGAGGTGPAGGAPWGGWGGMSGAVLPPPRKLLVPGGPAAVTGVEPLVEASVGA